MLVDVETFLFYSLVNTYTYTLIYYLEEADDGGNDTDAEGTHCGWLLVDNPVDEHPGGGCCRKPPPHTQCAIGR